MNFENRTVIITGASIGIGKATALEFAKFGANVCIVDINDTGLLELKKQIENLGARASCYICDVSDEDAVVEVTNKVLCEYGNIDVLVNNAGIWRMFKPFSETNSDEWKKLIDVNILGMMYFTRAVINSMIQNQYGRIINIGSVAGTYGNANMVAYSTTKGAVTSFTKALAKEVAEYGITVNNVVPGNVKNEGNGDNLHLSFIPRSGELEEFAYLITFLASDKASYISGQDYLIDGCRKKM